MPKKPKNPSPAPLSTSPSSSAYALEAEEWRAKNARAKAIIMSTLIPGSEPWKIAEPLELASDIWKALEDRYAPPGEHTSIRSGPQRSERSDFVSEWVEGKSLEKYKTGVRPGQMLTNFPADALMPEYNTALSVGERNTAMKRRETEVSDTHGQRMNELLDTNIAKIACTEDSEKDDARREQRKKEAQAAAARVLVEHMPNRDQRFLWALLHGGKEETMAWFNGTATA